MSTGTELIQTALKKIGAHSRLAPASSDTILDGRDALNSMLEVWRSKGIILDVVPLNAPGDDLGEPADTRNAIINNLAIEMATFFDNASQRVSDTLRLNARNSYNDVKDLYWNPDVTIQTRANQLPAGEGNPYETFFRSGSSSETALCLPSGGSSPASSGGAFGPVDVTSDDLSFNKLVNNSLAKGWQNKVDAEGGVTFNDLGAAVDFIIESDTNANLFHLDGTNNRIGIGAAPTNALLHLQSGSAGVVTANSVGNLLVLESDAAGGNGLSFLTKDGTSNAYIIAGDTANPVQGVIRFSHAANSWVIEENAVPLLHLGSGGGVTVNNSNNNFNFMVKGVSTDTLFVVDANLNANAGGVGISTAGLSPTDGLLHIQSASAGAVTANTAADELVLEGSGAGGMSLLFPTECTILFGDADDNDAGGIYYLHSQNTMRFRTNANVTRFQIDSTGNLVLGSGSAATTSQGNINIPINTSPTASLANGIVLGSKDSSAGSTDATLEMWLETAPIAVGTFTPSHKFPIWINGTEYHIQLDAV